MSRTAILEQVDNGVVVRLNDKDRTSVYVADVVSALGVVDAYFDQPRGATSRITRPVEILPGESDPLEPKPSLDTQPQVESDHYTPHVSTQRLRTPLPDVVKVKLPDTDLVQELAKRTDASVAATVRWARPRLDR